jgi:hypothetical protein
VGNASDFLYLTEVRTMDIIGSGICSRGYKLLLYVLGLDYSLGTNLNICLFTSQNRNEKEANT